MISKNENHELSKLSKQELHFLLMNLKQMYLKMRSTLNLDKNVTFGVEIESISKPQILFSDAIKKNLKIFNYIDGDIFFEYEELDQNWNVKHEWDPISAEITSPILTDNFKSWKELLTVCKFLQVNKVKLDATTGAHIHVGAHIMKDINSWINLIKLWTLYEHIIFRFAYGENLNYREYLLEYANPIRNKVIQNIKYMDEVEEVYFLLSLLDLKKSKTTGIDLNRILCFEENMLLQQNTIEIRCPNGTIKPEIWQNNINFFTKLILYANSEKFDSDYVDFYLEKLGYSSINNYYKLDISNALKLSDMIFDNYFDKLYFLKQYYKDGIESEKFEDTVKLVR